MSKFLIFSFLSLSLMACASQPSVTLDLGESPQPVDPDFQWPVYGASLTQKFRPKKKTPYRRIHQGIDLAAPKNTPIYAIDHGIVRYVGQGFTGYGRLVIVEHIDKRYRSYYAHLSRYKVEKGDIIKKGDLIGLMGRTGRATGVHLHFEVRKNKVAINPLDVLPTPALNASQQANP